MSRAATSKAKCPICRKPVTADYRPFCSKRCADVDLQRWFTGAYAVPAVEQEEVSDGEDEL
ncbi:DNA gyrase inhibitor YacG [Phenylobacterium sp.]|uniref:DNA gyrase inhibitor YacG n=1 Tax=Phenylobacterium sp. TaxID=1871053 RepID=UPI004035928E